MLIHGRVISLTITRGDEDSSQGYHHQITVSSEEWYVLNNTDNRYLLRNLQGDEISVIDEEGWINLAFENVTWECTCYENEECFQIYSRNIFYMLWGVLWISVCVCIKKAF